MGLDLNPIEHVWDTLQKAVNNRQAPVATVQELESPCIKSGTRCPKKQHNLVQSMSRWCQPVLQARRGHTHYHANRWQHFSEIRWLVESTVNNMILWDSLYSCFVVADLFLLHFNNQITIISGSIPRALHSLMTDNIRWQLLWLIINITTSTLFTF